MHLTEEILAPIRERYGQPAILEWEGDISEVEYELATYDPKRMHDVTLFILNGQDLDARGRALPDRAANQRLALIRKPTFPPDIWRPPGGGVRPGEDFVEAVQREAFEETGLSVELERYLVEARARFVYRPPGLEALSAKRPAPGQETGAPPAHLGREALSARPPAPGQEPGAPPAHLGLDWRTHVFLATTDDEELEPRDTEEIAEARWGTLEELAGPLRERLLATGRAFWRYRVALHDAALAALR
jgi:ADP-ribose pyrophosphatase YjhB (NUDIX family)